MKKILLSITFLLSFNSLLAADSTPLLSMTDKHYIKINKEIVSMFFQNGQNFVKRQHLDPDKPHCSIKDRAIHTVVLSRHQETPIFILKVSITRSTGNMSLSGPPHWNTQIDLRPVQFGGEDDYEAVSFRCISREQPIATFAQFYEQMGDYMKIKLYK